MAQNRGRTAANKDRGDVGYRIFFKERFSFGKQGIDKKLRPPVVRLQGHGIKIAVITFACAKRDVNVKGRFHTPRSNGADAGKGPVTEQGPA